ncbi:hypothetical protein LC2W_0566 [Lacticaseibacillus paracasei]|nr:hypothetical protein LC2W_0566 [Lacticaseibacillus paracasei]AEA56064.1 Hypothetical cytosolic protein [Lacticaseibacillus paracasei]QHV92952.1 hypothetical protein EOK76_g2572 [Lacticaseibacillus paracasei]BAN70759.1 hypothetical protein LBPC_0463 [Lacticaseibacillus paracasei subsp. paracasei]
MQVIQDGQVACQFLWPLFYLISFCDIMRSINVKPHFWPLSVLALSGFCFANYFVD